MMKRCTIFFLLLLVLPALAGADSSDRAYEKARDKYYQLQESQKLRLYRHNWLKVVDLFAGVAGKYPDGNRAADALYMAGKTSHELYGVSGLKDDARQAARYFDRVPDEYPHSSLADDALNLSAKIHETILEEPTPAYLRYREIVENYPGGDMQAKARGKVRDLSRYAPKKTVEPKKAATDQDGNRLRTVRFWSNSGYTRIVLEVDQPVRFTSNFLKGDSKRSVAPRIYVDLQQTRPVASLKKAQVVDDGLLRQIRAGQPDGETTRVVLDLDSFSDYKVFPLEQPFRIVIDVHGEKQVTADAAASAEPLTAPEGGQDDIAGLLDNAPKETPLKLHIPKSRNGQGLRRIVVDAGHGGKDPGAIGATGTREKDITLAIARILAKKLEQAFDCEVIMTRTGNSYLKLEERTAIANKVEADLFISIHANANKNRKVRGTETYYLNFSKSDKAIEVVARENDTSLQQVNDLEMILMDLMANSKINESSRLATEIQKSMVGKLGRNYKVKDLGVRGGPFYVLLGATMPSVLVETAFISNRNEEKLLKNRAYQERLADGIVAGVRNYATALKLLAAK